MDDDFKLKEVVMLHDGAKRIVVVVIDIMPHARQKYLVENADGRGMFAAPEELHRIKRDPLDVKA